MRLGKISFYEILLSACVAMIPQFAGAQQPCKGSPRNNQMAPFQDLFQKANYMVGIGDDPNGKPEEIDGRDSFAKVAENFGASPAEIEQILMSTGTVICPTPHSPSGKFQVGTGFLVDSNAEIATAKHLFEAVIKSEGVQGLRSCYYRTPDADIGLDFEAVPYQAGVGVALLGGDAIYRARLSSPVVGGSPIPIDQTPVRKNQQMLAYAGYQTSMVKKLPKGEPIGAIGYVRATNSVGYSTDIDMAQGGSGGPNFTWEGSGKNRHLVISGVTLRSGDPSLDGKPYKESQVAEERSTTFSLFASDSQVQVAEDPDAQPGPNQGEQESVKPVSGAASGLQI